MHLPEEGAPFEEPRRLSRVRSLLEHAALPLPDYARNEAERAGDFLWNLSSAESPTVPSFPRPFGRYVLLGVLGKGLERLRRTPSNAGNVRPNISIGVTDCKLIFP